MHCQHLSQLLDDIMDLQTQNPRKYDKHLRFSGQILFCKIFPKKRIGHSMFAHEREGPAFRFLCLSSCFVTQVKGKDYFFPQRIVFRNVNIISYGRQEKQKQKAQLSLLLLRE